MASGKTANKPIKKEVANQAKKNGKGKTEIVLKMVEAGKTRKQIIDKLEEMDSNISRKSNAALVSRIFKAHDLAGKVASGVERGATKKTIKVKGSG